MMNKLTLTLSAAVAIALAGSAYAAQDGGMRMKDPMGDKTVTRAEAETKARDHFAKLDANSDGKIDKADHAARQLEHFKKLDTDGNGSISQTEFLAAHQRGPGAGHPDMAKGHDMSGGMGGGKMGMRHKGGGMGGDHKMMMVRMADANKDGTITRDEFVGGMLKHFDMADANKDGKITPDERRAAMMKMHEQMKGMKGMKSGMNHDMGAMPKGDAPPPPHAH